ncbi:MAG: DUF1146 family protein [Bacilli bacterium]|nr:DUF1146 family protein [Bacilli bacterium]
MNYKVLLYVFFMMLSAFVLNGVNFNNFFRTGRKLEANIFILMLCMMMSYLLTNFVWDFIGQ